MSSKIPRCVSEGNKVARKIRKNRDFGPCSVTFMQGSRTLRMNSGRRKALRVIPRGKQWLTVYRAHQVLDAKMEISQNLWIRLTPEQFSILLQANGYPEMHSLCRFYSLSEFHIGGKVRACTRKRRFSRIFEFCRKCSGNINEASRAHRDARECF